jgi:tetratricopeptide (TPR) repeat protein
MKKRSDMAQSQIAVEDTLQRAMAAIQSRRPDEAARLARDVLEKNSSHPNALHILGYSYLMQERPGDAIELLEKAYRSLRDPAIETQLGIALRKAGRTDDALKRLARACKRTPPFPAAFHEYGFLLHMLDRDDEAIDILKRGIDLAPWMPELPILLGWIFHGRNDSENAKRVFAQAARASPNHADALYGLGLVLMDTGQFAPAADHFQQALRLNPSDQEPRLYLAACLLEMGQSGAAHACLRQVTRGGPSFYGRALKILATSGRGRFWLKPSEAVKFFNGERS